MNLVDCFVTKILSEPYFKYEKWWVTVEYNSYGRLSKTNLMFVSKKQATDDVHIGYKFLA